MYCRIAACAHDADTCLVSRHGNTHTHTHTHTFPPPCLSLSETVLVASLLSETHSHAYVCMYVCMHTYIYTYTHNPHPHKATCTRSQRTRARLLRDKIQRRRRKRLLHAHCMWAMPSSELHRRAAEGCPPHRRQQPTRTPHVRIPPTFPHTLTPPRLSAALVSCSDGRGLKRSLLDMSSPCSESQPPSMPCIHTGTKRPSHPLSSALPARGFTKGRPSRDVTWGTAHATKCM